MIHEPVDVARWTSLFALGELREEARRFVLDRRATMPYEYPTAESVDNHIARIEPGGQSVASPYHLAVVEQIREETGALQRVLGSVAADVFVFGRGEPARRDVTKIGGLPYWPRSRPWPRDAAGEPLTFVAQFCFADSRDIVGRLPGDVLLLFAAKEDLRQDVEEGALAVEWMPLGEATLMEAEEVPQGANTWEVPAFYGAIHRSRDYPGSEGHFSRYNRPERLAVLDGTKIGGVPPWIQIRKGFATDSSAASRRSTRKRIGRTHTSTSRPPSVRRTDANCRTRSGATRAC